MKRGKRAKNGLKSGQKFWDKEYAKPGHLSLSTNPSEDLEKFCRWQLRQQDAPQLGHQSSVLDLGCGNGRNLLYLAEQFSVSGSGIDISAEAIRQAKSLSTGHNLEFVTGSITDPFKLDDESQALVLDLMVSHILSKTERDFLLAEIYRVLKPGGFLLFKTFLLDGDAHAKRLLKEYPASEAGSYIHPEIGVAEHVFTEDEVKELLKEKFVVHKVVKSYRHRGKSAKRRSICVYAEKAY